MIQTCSQLNGNAVIWLVRWSKPAHNQHNTVIWLVRWSKPAHNSTQCRYLIGSLIQTCSQLNIIPLSDWFVDPNLLTTQHNTVIWLVRWSKPAHNSTQYRYLIGSLIQTCSQLNIIPLSDWFVDPNLLTTQHQLVRWSNLLTINIIPLSDWFVDPNLLTTQHNTVIWLVRWSKPAHNSTQYRYLIGSLIQTCSQLNIIPLSDWFVDPNLLTTQHNTVIWLVRWSKPAHNST